MATIALPAPPPIDGAPSLASLRTLGTGAQQAAAGNDTRFPSGLTAGRVVVATGATGIGNSNFTASANVLDLAAGGTLSLGTSIATGLTLGSASAMGTIAVQGQSLQVTQRALAGGNATGFLYLGAAHTTLTAGTEYLDFNIASNRTVQFATGAIATQRMALFQAPTYAFVGASTITDAATIAITGAPIAGANATITNPWSLWVQGGKARFDGNVYTPALDAVSAGALSLGTATATSIAAGSSGVTSIALTAKSWALSQNAFSSGSTAGLLFTGAAHTGLTASTEAIDINWNLARVVQHATGALTAQRAFVVQAPTYSFVGASTISDAATIAVTGAPVAGTNATITRPWALWLQAGNLGFAPAASFASASQGATNTTGLTLQPNVADGASSIALVINNGTALANATSKLISFQNNGTEIGSMRLSAVQPGGFKLMGDVTGGVSGFLELTYNGGAYLGYGTSYFQAGSNQANIADGTGLISLSSGNVTFTCFDLSPDANDTRTFGANHLWLSARAAKIIAAGTTAGNALAVWGRASNTNAMATFQDVNGNVRYGVDSVGLPSLGQNCYESETFANLSSSYATTGVLGNCPKWSVQISGTALGVKQVPSQFDTTSIIGNGAALDPGGTASNAVFVVNNNIYYLANNTSAVAVWEWSGLISLLSNTDIQMGVHASAQFTHPQGFGFIRRNGIDTNWQLWYDDGVTKTIQAPSSGVAPTASVYQRFRIEFYGSTAPGSTKTAKFYVDNTFIGSITGANVYTPSGGSDFIAATRAQATAATGYLVISAYQAWWSLRTTPLSP